MIAGMPLRYLLGAEHPQGEDGCVTMVPWGAEAAPRGLTAGYVNAFDETEQYNAGTNTGPFGPYRRPTPTAKEYREGVPDQDHDGYRRNICAQLDLRELQGITLCEIDNPDAYPLEAVLLAIDWAAERGIGVLAKNPGLGNMLGENFLPVIEHINVVGIIVEHGAGSAREMHQMRTNAGKRDLPVRFVAYEDGEGGQAWANGIAEEITRNNFADMGVTYSPGASEYATSVDVLRPKTGEGGSAMIIVMSSGHGSKISGAVDIIHEHEEAVRVVDRTAEYLRQAGVECITYEDTVSTSQDENLERLVSFHNSQGPHALDISVHFNSSNGTTSKPIGTEVFSYDDDTLAAKVSQAIADAGDLIDRGAKDGSGLYFCRNTAEKALLLEICFVNSQADCALYEQNFDLICQSIAGALSGEEIAPTPPGPGPDPEPPKPEPPPSGDKPMLKKGDKGPWVEELQHELNRELEGCHLTVDGDFGGATDSAVRSYQGSRGLDVDGICGDATWEALETHMPPLPPPPGALTVEQQEEIKDIVARSSIFGYSWGDRGVAPHGYTLGMGLAFAQTYIKLLNQHPAAIEMAKARTNSDKDALHVYRAEFNALGMSNEKNGPDTLRHLYALLLGHGMRESSGRHCEGRDMSADNVQSDTAESGLFQTSQNASGASDPEFDDLMDEYSDPVNRPTCYLDTFAEGVSCSESDWACYGSGVGYEFQKLCKECPAFAVESCALTLRNLCNHYGPIIRKETELKREAAEMFKAVQDYVDEEIEV
jgi:N-acetylmuramoyl-L-alanine amidase